MVKQKERRKYSTIGSPTRIAILIYFRHMKYRCTVLMLIFVACSSLIRAQEYGVSTVVNLSYSGLSQSIRYIRSGEKLTLQLGPKLSYSASRSAFSTYPGVSLQADYHPGCMGKYFLMYEYLPLAVTNGNSHIHEVYAGYGFRWSLNDFWKVQSGMGMGFYYEKGNSVKPYQIQGLAYCSNLGITYRF